MQNQDYPALFQAADTGSNRTQWYHHLTVKGYLGCLIIGACFSFYGINNSTLAIIAAVVFFIALALSILIITKNFENSWYNCRALAESIKTSTWKYMMRTEPYEDCDDVQIVKSEFRNLLKGLLKENRELSSDFAGEVSDKEQVTDFMNTVRNMDLNDRKDFYLTHRIDEQRTWYTKKSKENSDKKSLWFGLLIFFNFLALTLVILRIKFPNLPYFPVEILIVISGACLTWIQVKKFQELSSAYSLTAHEIGTVRGEIENIDTEEEFSDFVNDSENAFSREHTQWLAKRVH